MQEVRVFASLDFKFKVDLVLSGLYMGNINLSDYKMRIRAVQMQVVVALVGYRLAPENPHPIPFTDCVEGLKWVRRSIFFDLSYGVSEFNL